MISTIAFDADDTLWENEAFFHLTQQEFQALLADYADPDHLSEQLLETERKNLAIYGYGVKGFTLSMIETAITVTKGKIPSTLIHQIIERGHNLMMHPITLCTGVPDVLDQLADTYRLMLITKGDLFDQERKIAQSGLAEKFTAIEIITEKDPKNYLQLFKRHHIRPENTMMVGNSLRSDVRPVIEIGGWGVHVPHSRTWALEVAEPPTGHPRYRRIDTLTQLAPLLDHLFSDQSESN